MSGKYSSPVLDALKKDPNLDLVSCRRCGKKYHQADLRFKPWGANGFCSDKCWREAKEEYAEKQKEEQE